MVASIAGHPAARRSAAGAGLSLRGARSRGWFAGPDLAES